MMKEIPQRIVDWKATGRNLQFLRRNNQNLRRYVCWKLKSSDGNCTGDCMSCTIEMDNLISQKELADVFYVTENSVTNWEGGRSCPTITDLFRYADLCGIPLEQVIVFEKRRQKEL